MYIIIGVLFAIALLLMLVDLCMPGQLYFSLRPWWLTILLVCAVIILYKNWPAIKEMTGI